MSARAQYGEDLLLLELFGPGYEGVYLEVGAHDGLRNSNTYMFEQAGWTGVLVEPDPDTARTCAGNRPGATVVQAAAVSPGVPSPVTFQRSELSDHSSLTLDRRHRKKLESLTGDIAVEQIQVPAKTVTEILGENRIDRIDFVTIDVEGHEQAVLEGFDMDRWRPAVIIVERNYLVPRPPILRLLHRNRYSYLRTTGVNDWFIDADRDDAPSLRGLPLLARELIPKLASQAKMRTKHEVKRLLQATGLR
jgi:FkbM family methyltransferase